MQAQKNQNALCILDLKKNPNTPGGITISNLIMYCRDMVGKIT